MATSFEEIYDYFLSNISDFSLLELEETMLEDNLETWLMNAIVNYPNTKTDISDFDRISKTFNDDLEHYEKVIIGKLMAIEYLNPFILDETLLREKLNSKDYRVFSTSNHLKTLTDLKIKYQSEISVMISRNSYTSKNLKEKFGNRNDKI